VSTKLPHTSHSRLVWGSLFFQPCLGKFLYSLVK